MGAYTSFRIQQSHTSAQNPSTRKWKTAIVLELPREFGDRTLDADFDFSMLALPCCHSVPTNSHDTGILFEITFTFRSRAKTHCIGVDRKRIPIESVWKSSEAHSLIEMKVKTLRRGGRFIEAKKPLFFLRLSRSLESINKTGRLQFSVGQFMEGNEVRVASKILLDPNCAHRTNCGALCLSNGFGFLPSIQCRRGALASPAQLRYIAMYAHRSCT